MRDSHRRRSWPRLGAVARGAHREQVEVPVRLDGERLDRALAGLVEQLSRGMARRIIGMGSVYIGLERCRVASRKVRAGDRLTVTWHPDVKAPRTFPLEVIWESRDLVAVHKPSGQIVQGTELGDVGTLARELVGRFGDDIRLMHRMDAPASGVLVAARKGPSTEGLAAQFRTHDIKRCYVAITSESPLEGCCERPLIRDGRRMRVASQGEDGLSARTDFKVVAHSEGRFLVRASLHTGRTHQIRVHLASMGAPIVGDRFYGGERSDRMCLHGYQLGFRAPANGEDVLLDCPPGADFWSAGGMSSDVAPEGAMK